MLTIVMMTTKMMVSPMIMLINHQDNHHGDGDGYDEGYDGDDGGFGHDRDEDSSGADGDHGDGANAGEVVALVSVTQ